MFETNNINDTEMIYSILRERNPDNQIDITYNYDDKKYTLILTNKKYTTDPEIDLDVKIVTIYGDTDSCFLSFKFNRDSFEQNRIDTFKLAIQCGENITKNVFKRPPIDLEFEKIFQPFVLLSKKKYIGLKYEDPNNPFKLKTITKAGTAVTRRNYAKVVKDCYNEIIDCICKESIDVNECVEIYRKYVDRIDNYQIDFEDLRLSAMLAAKYKTRPVHVVLAEKLEKRNEAVQIGSRIPYIYIEDTSGQKLKKSELGEDPEYAKLNELKYNRGCYLNQVAKPVLGFLKIILDSERNLLNEIIDYTNEKLISYGEAKLKPSDFKLSEDDEVADDE